MYKTLGFKWLFEMFCRASSVVSVDRDEARNPQRFIHVSVSGDRETTTNLRYKVGRNLQYERRDVLEVRDPEDAKLPRPNVSSTFIFAKEDKYFLYPNNYNYYRNTFQHGGISLEEMICPVIRLRTR